MNNNDKKQQIKTISLDLLLLLLLLPPTADNDGQLYVCTLYCYLTFSFMVLSSGRN